MNFRTEKIDRAIIITQYDLRGFDHPLGIRMKKGESAKCSSVIPGNFVAFAAGLGEESNKQPLPDTYVDHYVSSFEQCLTMCKQLASDCDASEREAVQLIIKDIVQQSEEMKAKVAVGFKEIDSAGYLQPLERDNWWGRIVLALVEAFDVSLERVWRA